MDPAKTAFTEAAADRAACKGLDEAEYLCFWQEQTSRSLLAWFFKRMAGTE